MDNKLYINFSKTQDFDCIDYYLKHIIRRAIASTLCYEGFEHDAEVSVTLTDNENIKNLNKKYRNKNTPTDVLSFPMYDLSVEDEESFIDGETVMLGDIVISLERARAQAEEIGNTFVEEVAFLTVHSTLHLLGYDHEAGSDEEEAQCLAQKEIIAVLDI
ncbi:MAG: rRNA maturation RNase YbeY [Clostridia bacterium]|nr:rRNA maturation RNase YbeY [Clostridia bacterium]